MNIAIGFRPRSGPWGGGNQFAAALTAFLQQRGHDVGFTLDRPDLDVILLTEPRRSSASSAFNDVDVWHYLTGVNRRTLVVHRINECDERKNTRGTNARLALANRCADHTVFISSWLRDLFQSHRHRLAEPSVILNGADQDVFHATGAVAWDGTGKISLVTHHWGANWSKGFDIYTRLDALLAGPPFDELFEFTYVGSLPPGVSLPRTRTVAPLAGQALAEELRRHHVYVTASLHEPAGMHHIEGALCGLPLLYRLSGALPQYCEGFGIPFDETTFEDRLLDIRGRYAALKPKMAAYPHTAVTMCRAYEALLETLLCRRNEILAGRRWNRVSARGTRVTAMLYDAWYRRMLKTGEVGHRRTT
jgi:hypothetical protein